MSEEGIHRVIALARDRRDTLRKTPVKNICRAIERLSPLWSAEGSYRKEYLMTGPEKTLGLSVPMITLGLDIFAASLDEGELVHRLDQQLGGYGCVDAFVERGGRSYRAEPLGVVLHVAAGNIIFGPAESLFAGLLTKNVGIIKAPAGGWDFLRLLVKSLNEIAPDIARTIGLLYWPGGEESTERAMVSGVDGVQIASGAEAISAYRRYALPHTALIEFGPRASLAVISSDAADRVDMDGLAHDVALWEQTACTSAQCIYVEGEENAAKVADRLSVALRDLSARLPEGNVTLDERIDIARMRELSSFGTIQGRSRLVSAFPDSTTTVVLEMDPDFEFSPLRRCVRVKSYKTPDELTGALEPLRGILQTVGLAVDVREFPDYRDRLCAAGVRRICRIGRMNQPGTQAIRDGVLELQRLVRWVEVDGA
ncbi:MAG: acyl-CoA reductase [Nitrospirota bacterium]